MLETSTCRRYFHQRGRHPVALAEILAGTVVARGYSTGKPTGEDPMNSTEQTGNLSNSERTWSAVLGASLSLLAMGRGSTILRSLGAVTGAALLARALAGHCGVKAALGGHTSLGEGLRDQWRHIRPQRSDARHGLPGSPVHAAKSEAIDTAVEESFPASDPPASRLPDDPPVNAEAKWEATRAAEGGQRSGDGRSTPGGRT
jgi:hypothetical protein